MNATNTNPAKANSAHLVLEDGSIYGGYAFGARAPAVGEVVFATSMTGYQEMLTDPSFAGQIVVPTYPLIGNYGINRRDFESRKVQVAGFVVREHSLRPSHALSDMTLDEFLQSEGVSAISGVDTRAITRRLRTRGVMMGAIGIDEPPQHTLDRLKQAPAYGDVDFVRQVTTNAAYDWNNPLWRKPAPETRRRILVSDFGLKYNILRMLRSRGCEVVAMPATATAQDILARNPDGVMLSPGPGDPELLDYAVDAAKGLIGRLPVFGICLGNQVVGRAVGGSTFKLKFGHRGANHPVKDLQTGLVHITAQNHGYAVDADSLPSEVEMSHININDGTLEGLRHKSLPVMTIQYHSEASPGPLDNEYMFDRFIEMIEDAANR